MAVGMGSPAVNDVPTRKPGSEAMDARLPKNGELGAGACARALSTKEAGNALLKVGDLDAARKAYDSGILDATIASADASRSDVSGGIRRERQRLLVTLLSNRALVNLRLGSYGDALSDCDRALSVDSLHAKARYRRGEALVGLHRYAEAAEVFSELLQSDFHQGDDNGGIVDAARAALARVEASQARATRIEKGDLEFAAMVAEAAQSGCLRLQHSVCRAKFVNNALKFKPPLPAPGDGRARCYSQRAIEAGALLVATPPLIFASYQELSASGHTILLDNAVGALRVGHDAVSSLQKLSGTDDVDELVVRELLRKSTAACATGVGLWADIAFVNHAESANTTRFYIADWAFLRAQRDIDVGEEVTLSYVDRTGDFAPQASWLDSIGVVDEVVQERALRWDCVSDDPLASVKAALSGSVEHSLKQLMEERELAPLAEQSRYLALLDAADGEVWCWGQLVRWLRNEQAASRDRGQMQRALGAALAIADLLERHSADCPSVEVLHAWADCAAILFDLPGNSSDEDQAVAMELCIDGVQRGVEFVFGSVLAEDPDFSTVVLQWATSRWWHASEWQRSATAAAAAAAAAASADQSDVSQDSQQADADSPLELSGMD